MQGFTTHKSATMGEDGDDYDGDNDEDDDDVM